MSDRNYKLIKWYTVAATIVNLILLSCVLCQTDVRENDAIRAIIGEASSEGYQGMLAVAAAIRNRDTLNGVYGMKAKHVDREPDWVWELAKKAWYASADADPTNGATHWESSDFAVPFWAKNMEVTYRYKKHIFYKERKHGKD